MTLSAISICISIAVAFAAIISPIIVAVLNNRHQLKLKQLELAQQHFEQTTMYKRDIWENYLCTAGRCIAYADSKAEQGYGEWYFKALLYATPELRDQMIEIHTQMQKPDWNAATVGFEKIIPQIESLIKTL